MKSIVRIILLALLAVAEESSIMSTAVGIDEEIRHDSKASNAFDQHYWVIPFVSTEIGANGA